MFCGDWLQRREMLSPNKVSLVDAVNDNRPITYREWNQTTNQLANLLREKLAKLALLSGPGSRLLGCSTVRLLGMQEEASPGCDRGPVKQPFRRFPNSLTA